MGHPWHEYWHETPDSPYLRAEANYLASRIKDRFGLAGTETILDFGCGYGYVAEALAPHCREVLLWDTVEPVMKTAEMRIHLPTVRTVAEDNFETLERVDLVVVNSVVQYMSNDELCTWLAIWKGMLSPHGNILISDVAEEHPSILYEAAQWFSLALQKGVLIDAIRFALANTKRYRSTAQRMPLNTLSDEDLSEMASECGLQMTKEPHNLAYQPRRSSYVLAGGDG